MASPLAVRASRRVRTFGGTGSTVGGRGCALTENVWVFGALFAWDCNHRTKAASCLARGFEVPVSGAVSTDDSECVGTTMDRKLVPEKAKISTELGGFRLCQILSQSLGFEIVL